jgi:hypothetical protein
MATYRRDHVDVRNRLAELGWKIEELLEVADAMVRARRSCTDNDPPSAPGWMSWKDGTRRLREIGRTKGLEKADIDQIPYVLDLKRHLRLAVSNADDGTGIENRVPQNQNKKGPGTDRAVNGNEGCLFSDLPRIPLSKIPPTPGIYVTWFLLVYSIGDTVRAELSCPVSFDGRYFTGFSERIILLGEGDDGGVSVRRDPISPTEPEFDIPVSRKPEK